MCTGGFENNLQMQRDYFGLQEAFPLGTPGNTGDGLKILQKAGADMWHLRNQGQSGGIWPGLRFPGHPTVFLRQLFWQSFSWIDIGADHRRFFDETWEWQLTHYKERVHGQWIDTPHHRVTPMHMLFDETTRRHNCLITTIMTWNAVVENYAWSDDNSAEVAKGWIVAGRQHRGTRGEDRPRPGRGGRDGARLQRRLRRGPRRGVRPQPADAAAAREAAVLRGRDRAGDRLHRRRRAPQRLTEWHRRPRHPPEGRGGGTGEAAKVAPLPNPGGPPVTYAAITGWGKCLPPSVLTNADLATFLDTNDEWIVSRTGIKERRVSHVPLEELGYVAAMRALAAAGLDPAEIELIVFGTCSFDDQVPNQASGLQVRLGAKKAAAMDVNTACTSFLYALSTATAMIRTGVVRNAVVLGGELISAFMDWRNRGVSVLFGDGCAAVVLQATDREEGLLAERLGCDSDARGTLVVEGMGTRYANFTRMYGDTNWIFEGQEIFKRAVMGMAGACADVLAGGT